MCTIVGYVGKKYGAAFVLEGLTRLGYRGYDSAGLACLNPNNHQIVYLKSQGLIKNLVTQLEHAPMDGFLVIGHTRWATHGAISAENAHPQFDCGKTIAVVHNGIIENHHGIKKQLEDAGHIFHSETDSEIIAHLFEALLNSHTTFKSAIIDLVSRLEGAYAFVLMLQSHPDSLLLVRKRSSLCIGIGDDQMFIASDPLAFANTTKKAIFMPDESFAIVSKDMIELYNFAGKALPMQIQAIDLSWVHQEKAGHEHFMLKEIYEQKQAIYATVTSLASSSNRIWEQLGISKEQAKKLQCIYLIGCGTSWHAARIAQFFFEDLCQIPAKIQLASEFRYMRFFQENHKNCLYVFISQSGETADTMEALRMVKMYGLPTVALTNVASSNMVREADGFMFTQAGPEVAIASTKAFATQITALYWLANCLALEKKIITQAQMELAQEDLLIAAEVLENSIENYKQTITHTLAKRYATFSKAIFLGRHISYPFALEAALKLKEVSYIFAQCYPAGELKHGPIALIDHQTPIFMFSHQDPLIYQKLLSNAQEIKARGGHLIIFAFSGQEELCSLADVAFVIARVKPLLEPLAMTGLMQFLVYQISKELERPIDRPRNLTKAITVE